MIFVFDHDDRGLEVFQSKREAISACEGIDVEDSPCEFWDNDGKALRAVFTKPNKRGSFSSVSGTYQLEPNPTGASLIEILPKVSYVEGTPPLNSLEAVRQHLTSQANGTQRSCAPS
jgi:hypothetical protein